MPNPPQQLPLDERLKRSLQEYVTSEIQRGIRRNFDAIADPAAFIADNDPAPAHLNFSKVMVRQVCRAWARGSTPIQGPLADFTYRPICTPYLDSLGETPPNGRLGLPFTGGQCPGALYSAQPEVFNTGSGTWGAFTTISNMRGPVLRLRIERVNANNSIWVAEYTGPGGVGVDFQTVSNGVPLNRARWGPVFPQVGQPNNCGDPDPVYLAPRTIPDLPDLTGTPVELPGAGPTPITIEFDDDGNIVVDFPDLDLTFTVPNPLLDDSQTADGLAPGDQGSPGGTAEAGAEDAEGEAPAGSVLVGLRLQLVAAPPNANKYSPAVYRGAAYIYMGGDVGLDQDFAGSMLVADQFIYAEKDNFTRYKVSANLGYRWNVTPYFREV